VNGIQPEAVFRYTVTHFSDSCCRFDCWRTRWRRGKRKWKRNRRRCQWLRRMKHWSYQWALDGMSAPE